MIPLLLAFMFAAGLGLATFSLFLPPRTRVLMTPRRIGKGNRLEKFLDNQHQFLAEVGLAERLPLALYFLIRIVVAAIVYILAYGLLGPVTAVLFALAGFLAVRWVLSAQRARRMRAVTEGVIDFGHAFVALLKAGTQPHEAITVLAGPSGPPAMRNYLIVLAQEIRTEGMAQAMVKSIDRVADPLFDTLATAILVQSEKGAELSEALQVTIKNIEQGAILIRRASSLKMQATMAALITPSMISVLVFSFQLHDGRSGGYFSYYYTTPWSNPPGVGQFVEVAVLGMFVAGYFVMKRIQRIPPPPRIRLREKV